MAMRMKALLDVARISFLCGRQLCQIINVRVLTIITKVP